MKYYESKEKTVNYGLIKTKTDARRRKNIGKKDKILVKSSVNSKIRIKFFVNIPKNDKKRKNKPQNLLTKRKTGDIMQ